MLDDLGNELAVCPTPVYESPLPSRLGQARYHDLRPSSTTPLDRRSGFVVKIVRRKISENKKLHLPMWLRGTSRPYVFPQSYFIVNVDS